MADTSERLDGEARAFVVAARSATLATIAPDGRPRPVPVCFELVAQDLWIAIDDKPKRSTDPMGLARVRDILERPAVSLLVDRWDEDWTRLGWVRIEGQAVRSSLLGRPGTRPRSRPCGRNTRNTVRTASRSGPPSGSRSGAS